MAKITLDLTKTVEQNAGVYYDKAKKAKKKLAGALEALEKSRQKLEKVKKEEIKKIEEEKKPAKRKKEWCEKFRWFTTSDGFLVIGGRDATSNEIVIKKHTDNDDLVFHTDMAGSPFFVIKSSGKEITETAKLEAADATCSFSRAWKLGLTTQSVFYVKPEQVTKEANPGEYLPRGAFMIRGKTEYIDNSVNCAVGMTEDGRVMAGPIEAVKKHCKKFVELEQGSEKSSQTAKKVKSKIGGEVDDIIRAMPSGGVKVKK